VRTLATKVKEEKKQTQLVEKPEETPEKKKAAGLALNKKKGAILPSKKTMNFVPRRKALSSSTVAIVVLVVFAVVVVLTKFGFLDPLSKKSTAELKLANAQAELAELEAKINEYGDLALDYDRYSFYWMTDTELSLVNRIDVLKLLEKQVMSVATIENFSIDDNIMTLNIRGVTLERASAIVKELENSSMVESAAVYSASAADAVEASIFMSITLTKEAEAE